MQPLSGLGFNRVPRGKGEANLQQPIESDRHRQAEAQSNPNQPLQGLLSACQSGHRHGTGKSRH